MCEQHDGDCEVEVREKRWRKQHNGQPLPPDWFGDPPSDEWLTIYRKAPIKAGGLEGSNCMIGDLKNMSSPPCNKRIVVVDIPWNYSVILGPKEKMFVRSGAHQQILVLAKGHATPSGEFYHRFGIGINHVPPHQTVFTDEFVHKTP